VVQRRGHARGVFRSIRVFKIKFDLILLLFLPSQTFDIVLEATFLRLGFPSLNPFALQFNTRTLLPHLVTPILFLGPIFTGYLGGELPGQRNWMWRTHVVARFFRIQGLRNYCIVRRLCIVIHLRLCKANENDNRHLSQKKLCFARACLQFTTYQARRGRR
jgi:hypothetical protein